MNGYSHSQNSSKGILAVHSQGIFKRNFQNKLSSVNAPSIQLATTFISIQSGFIKTCISIIHHGKIIQHSSFPNLARSPTGLQHQTALHHSEISLTGRKRIESPIACGSPEERFLTIHPTANDLHDMWRKACDTAARCISEAKDTINRVRTNLTWNLTSKKKTRYLLVSTLNFNNLKGPKKMRDSFVGPFTIINL
ncbi:hypothetical protein O181_012347 [Austropuccinia psidii MF-1]|uniref:Uncharacterized protein n=1 Tax=Austropuccinia psidii MF-1 TaxID=1389203 RepID=A0A9Q3GMY6_9BASI|nr:hypothetical protein [Austropuccinia psidii MF-1]